MPTGLWDNKPAIYLNGNQENKVPTLSSIAIFLSTFFSTTLYTPLLQSVPGCDTYSWFQMSRLLYFLTNKRDGTFLNVLQIPIVAAAKVLLFIFLLNSVQHIDDSVTVSFLPLQHRRYLMIQ